MLKMLGYMSAGNNAIDTVLKWVEYAAIVVEVISVLIIFVATIVALTLFLWRCTSQTIEVNPYHELKIQLARALLLGLELLVAADVIYTVALEATLQSVIVLGLLVLIRTFLSWALIVELDGHWPWHKSNIIQEKGL